jgi:hypothetical protein
MLTEDDYTNIRNWEKINNDGSIRYFDCFDKILISGRLSEFEAGERILYNNESFVKGDNAFEKVSSLLSLNLTGKTIIFDNETHEIGSLKISEKNVTLKGVNGAKLHGKIIFSNPTGCSIKNLKISKATANSPELEPSEFLIECLSGGSNFNLEDSSFTITEGHGSCLKIPETIENFNVSRCFFNVNKFTGRVSIPSMVLATVKNSKIEYSTLKGQLIIGGISTFSFENNTIEFDNSAAFNIDGLFEGLTEIRGNRIMGGEYYTSVCKLSNIKNFGALSIKYNDMSYTLALIEIDESPIDIEQIQIDFNTIKDQKTSSYVIKNGIAQRVKLSDGNSLSNIRFIDCGRAR